MREAKRPRRSKLGDFQAGDIAQAIRRDHEKDRVRLIGIDDLIAGKNQPRKNFENIQDLVDSIREKGVIEPLIVRPKGIKYEIVVGERRYRAAQQAGLREVPCLVREYSDDEMLEVALIENLQREDLNPIEETQGIIDLLNLKMSAFEEFKNFEKGAISVLNTMHNYKRGRITHNVIGKIQKVVEDLFSLTAMKWESFLINRVPLLSLPDDLKDALIHHKSFKPAHAREIGKIDDPALRGQLIKAVLDDGMGLRELKMRVGLYQEKMTGGVPGEEKKQGFITFDEVPKLKYRPSKKAHTFTISKKADLVETLRLLADLVEQGKLSSYISED